MLAEADHWDPVTRDAILERARSVPPVRFFTAVEERCLRAFLDVLFAQDSEPRVPVFEMVDSKLHQGKLDGFQYDDMPDDRNTWRLVARGLDEAAGEGGFAALDDGARKAIVSRFADSDLSGSAWEELNVSRAWSVVTRGALSEFYSHPWAWNEIGFGGPAYPRGYMRLHAGPGGREPYEAQEAFDLDPVEEA